MSYHAAGSNYAAVADGHSRQDQHVAAKPYIIPDADVNAILIARGPRLRMDGMSGGINTHIRRELGILTDTNLSHIQNRQAIIGKKVLTYFDIPAVIAVKGRLNMHMLTGLPQDALDQVFLL